MTGKWHGHGLGHRCGNCGLIFLDEEIPFRFDDELNLCVRCIFEERQERNPIALTPCYGERYDGASPSCTRICQLREECLIQVIDSRAGDVALGLKKFEKERKTRNPRGYARHAARILRVVGEPMHLLDLIPLIEKSTKRRRQIDARRMRRHLMKSGDIVCLGQNFFCWIGIWDPTGGGEPGYVYKYHKSSGLTPVRELVEDFRKEEK